MPKELRAELTGSVVKLYKAIGDSFEAGEPLVLLESMKMEIPVNAPEAGVVTSIHIWEGGSVEEDEVMLAYTIEN